MRSWPWKGSTEVHVGLNDLHIGLNLHSHFEVLCSDVMDTLSAAARRYHLPCGFGAVGRTKDSSLPIPPDQVIGEMVRLGASRAALSRYFFPGPGEPFHFGEEILRLRERLDYWSQAGAEALLRNRQALRSSARSYREKKGLQR